MNSMRDKPNEQHEPTRRRVQNTKVEDGTVLGTNTLHMSEVSGSIKKKTYNPRMIWIEVSQSQILHLLINSVIQLIPKKKLYSNNLCQTLNVGS